MDVRLPRSLSNWKLEMLVLEERRKPEYLEKNLSEQGKEPTTNSTHIWCRRQDLNPGPYLDREKSQTRGKMAPTFGSYSFVVFCFSQFGVKIGLT